MKKAEKAPLISVWPRLGGGNGYWPRQDFMLVAIPRRD